MTHHQEPFPSVFIGNLSPIKNKKVETPDYNPRGWKKIDNAFTLIELLVVVLIIGILSAIALPQYQKAVHKTPMMENITRAKAFRDAIDLYLLENPTLPAPEHDIDLADVYPDLMSGLTQNNSRYVSKYGFYTVSCRSTDCNYNASYANAGNLVAEIGGSKLSANSDWLLYCYYEDNLGKYLCNSIKEFGYTDIQEGF